MKQILFIINALFVVVILGLYSIGLLDGDDDYYIGAALGQLGLGVFQLVVALILTIAVAKKQHKNLVRLLQLYWGVVITYFLAGIVMALVGMEMFVERNIPTTIVGIPMTIAIYFVYVTYSYSKQDHETV